MEPSPLVTPAWCIVSVYRPDLLQEAKTRFAGDDVDVVVDRRVGERRRPERAESDESRAKDRRRLSIDEYLRTQGLVVVSRQN
ncbi:MAG: hypothetical protein DMD84_22555 [Candidatus Rokuibacteriota bacterium]|nr:MAG: hypothetical protein DMD84_22555 [Candidatus Rokubacteria bacterium]